MTTPGWALRAAVGAAGWAWLGLGLAQAGVIPPTKPDLRLDTGSLVTLSLYQLDSTLPATITLNSPSRCTTTGTAFYRDVTDCWLPEWNPLTEGKSVFVVINGSTDAATLVPPTTPPTFPLASGTTNPFVAALTTSAYPGQCVNFGSSTEADFELPPLPTPMTLQTSPTTSVVARYELKPKDCGGMAVIQVGSSKFIVPRDGTATTAANGIPEVWEDLHGGPLNPWEDIDTGPLAASSCCDGIATFDEYRGFIVSKNQVRTHPRQKDVFLHVMNPLCTGGTSGTDFLGSTASLLGNGTTTYPTTGKSPFANVHTLLSPDRFHILGYTPGATNFKTDEWVDNFTSLTSSTILTVSDSATDRTVNPNRLYGPRQKGIRIMECVDTASPSLLGWALGVASPNDAGNVIVYTQRIANYMNGLITTDIAKSVKYSTFMNGAWTSPQDLGLASNPPLASDAVRNSIISEAILFVLTMEIVHSMNLTPGVQGTQKATYGHHFAPSTGDCADQAMTNVAKGSSNTFYIPSVCGSTDQTQFLVR